MNVDQIRVANASHQNSLKTPCMLNWVGSDELRFRIYVKRKRLLVKLAQVLSQCRHDELLKVDEIVKSFWRNDLYEDILQMPLTTTNEKTRCHP